MRRLTAAYAAALILLAVSLGGFWVIILQPA